MLSYRHAFHAGNHADVIKHLCVVLCCTHLCKKDKPLCYLDTHAGAGMYKLNSDAAQKNQEYVDGIEQLLRADARPAVFDTYLSLIAQARQKNQNHYPGSPWFAAQILRAYDTLHLNELHPHDFQILAQVFAGDKRIKPAQQDGFQSLKRLLPPAARRGITLIDPPYEQEQEYQSVINALKEGVKRFNTGVYIVWYPLINRQASTKSKASEKMLQQIQNEFSQEQLHAQLIHDPQAKGMYGSGLAIINPPWGLTEQLEDALRFLCQQSAVRKSQYSVVFQALNQNRKA